MTFYPRNSRLKAVYNEVFKHLGNPGYFLFMVTPIFFIVALFFYLAVYPPLMWWVAGLIYEEETTCVYEVYTGNPKAIRTNYLVMGNGRVIVSKVRAYLRPRDIYAYGKCGGGKVVFRGPWVKFGTESWMPRKYYDETERFAPIVGPALAHVRGESAVFNALGRNTEEVKAYMMKQFGLTERDVFETEALDEPKKGGVEIGVDLGRLQGTDFLNKIPGNVFRYTFHTRKGYINCSTWVDSKAVRTSECFAPTDERKPLLPIPARTDI